MNIIITGGAGFIGSNAIEYFLRKGQAVHVVDCFTYAGDFSRVPETVKLWWGDISILNWRAILDEAEPDVIINYAGETFVDRSLQDKEAKVFIHSNVLGVQRTIAEIRNYQRDTGKKILFIQISTDEVLGDLPFESVEEYAEDQLLAPNNFYAATKASAELIIRAIHHSFSDFDYVICRAANNYGPNQNKEKFLPTVISNALIGNKIPIYGEGRNKREWLWVDDFTNGIDLIINKYFSEKEMVLNDLFHFGSSVRIDNLSLVKTVLKIMNKSEDLISFVPDRPGHDRRYALNCAKAHRRLDWCPKMCLEDGLEIVVKDITNRFKKGLLP
jgi:dTDP-glucose 4,6-dehydratase